MFNTEEDKNICYYYTYTLTVPANNPDIFMDTQFYVDIMH